MDAEFDRKDFFYDLPERASNDVNGEVPAKDLSLSYDPPHAHSEMTGEVPASQEEQNDLGRDLGYLYDDPWPRLLRWGRKWISPQQCVFDTPESIGNPA